MHESVQHLAVLVHLDVELSEAPGPTDRAAGDAHGLLQLLQLGQPIWGAVYNAARLNSAASGLSVSAEV